MTTAASPGATHSAVLLPAPAAEAAVQAWRLRWDRSAAWGVPAHVTLLYPFVAPAAIDRRVVDRLRALFGARAPVAITLSTVRRFDGGVLYLAPESADPIRALTAALVAAFPGHPPYRGAFDQVVPHLTVTDGAPTEVTDAAEADLTRHLPIRWTAGEAWLMTGTDSAASWRVVERFPLGR